MGILPAESGAYAPITGVPIDLVGLPHRVGLLFHRSVDVRGICGGHLQVADGARDESSRAVVQPMRSSRCGVAMRGVFGIGSLGDAHLEGQPARIQPQSCRERNMRRSAGTESYQSDLVHDFGEHLVVAVRQLWNNLCHQQHEPHERQHLGSHAVDVIQLVESRSGRATGPSNGGVQ